MLYVLGDDGARRFECRPLIGIAAVQTDNAVPCFASLAHHHSAVAGGHSPNVSVTGSYLDATPVVYYIA